MMMEVDAYKVLDDYFINDLTKEQVEKKYNFPFNSIRYTHSIQLTYDKPLFMDTVQKDFDNLKESEFIKKHRISRHAYLNLYEGYLFQSKSFIKWLKRLNIEFSTTYEKVTKYTPHGEFVKFGPDNFNKVGLHKQSIEKPVKQTKHVRKVPESMKHYLNLIDSQFKITNDFLYEKGLSAITISRIEERISAMIRFAIGVGIDAEKYGFSSKLVYAMAKKEGIL